MARVFEVRRTCQAENLSASVVVQKMVVPRTVLDVEKLAIFIGPSAAGPKRHMGHRSLLEGYVVCTDFCSKVSASECHRQWVHATYFFTFKYGHEWILALAAPVS